MEEFDLSKLTSSDIMYGLGSVIGGIFYAIRSLGKGKSSTEEESITATTEADLIKILRHHVDDEAEKNKSQQIEIKELKQSIDLLEDECSALKRKLRKFEDYLDQAHYIYPNLSRDIDELTVQSDYRNLPRLERRTHNVPIENDRRIN